MSVKHNVCLVVIDGYGINPVKGYKGDAIANAKTPTMDSFIGQPGYTPLEASSLAVGLPEGLMGNSEVGHMNLGAGRVCWQDVVRIDQSIKKGTFKDVKNIVRACEHAKNGNGRLHFLGLLSDGGVHSHQDHLYELLKVAKAHNVPHVYIHCFGDGRDTDPKSLTHYLAQLEEKIKEIGIGEIATIVGRYYAMDRDRRWERVDVAIRALVLGEGENSSDVISTVKERYAKGENDEFIKPIIADGQVGRLQDDDTLFFFNYRSDRVREITQLLGVDSSPIKTKIPKNLDITTMTQYKAEYPFPIAFPPQHMGNVLAEWLSKQGIEQCHVAETEKYAHVTFFFNGGVEKQFPKETRDMIPSPKVATYDKDPKMSQLKVAAKMSERLSEHEFPFIMCNLAAPDMVGHTGVYEAAVEAVSYCDEAIKEILDACKKNNYIFFVTADHGNAEEMLTPQGKIKTSHTTNPVPFAMQNEPKGWGLKKTDGVLGDVAPTLLDAMGVPQPEEMTGHSLLVRK